MRVHQILAHFGMGDAVSNQALAIRDVLRGWEIECFIYARSRDGGPASRIALPDSEYQRYRGNREDLLIYHHSIYCDNYREFLKTKNKKVLIYHNITPAEFFEPYDREVAEQCRKGRDILPLFTEGDLFLGDSEFNRRELVEAGLPEERSGVLPILPDIQRLRSGKIDPWLKRIFMDGKTNLLFVGRIMPNKRVEDLIALFHHYHRAINLKSRLVLAGGLFYPYVSRLCALARRLGLGDHILFLGKIGDFSLGTCYRHADFYLSMSEHEGFCVPLLEAFGFDVPVFAYSAGAVPETMGEAGVIFDEKDHALLSELLENVRSDRLTKERIISAQKLRLEYFSEEAFSEKLSSLFWGLLR